MHFQRSGKNTVRHFTDKIIEGLKDLNFLTQFRIDFKRKEEYTAGGFDDIEYEISTNLGESVKPLGRIVSGGELSRIMLAIKAILADRDQIETLIFDEIDTGISEGQHRRFQRRCLDRKDIIRYSASQSATDRCDGGHAF